MYSKTIFSLTIGILNLDSRLSSSVRLLKILLVQVLPPSCPKQSLGVGELEEGNVIRTKGDFC